MTESTPNPGNPTSGLIPARRQRRRHALVLVTILLAFAALAGLGAWLHRTPGPPEPTADQSLHPQLLQAVVDIAPEGGMGGGCGGLIDQECRLVVTIAAVMAGADSARVLFPPGPPAQGEEAGIAARVVHRDPNRMIDLLQLERLPSQALALPLGDQLPGSGETLHTLRRPEPPASTSWAYRRGVLERMLMRPHY